MRRADRFELRLPRLHRRLAAEADFLEFLGKFLGEEIEHLLRLGRTGRVKLRAILCVPISIIVFFAHAFGWGALGLMCFSAEAVRQHDKGRGWFLSGVKAAVKASVMALPLLFMILWRTDMPAGMTRNFFMWQLKWEWIHSALRDRWRAFDHASMAVIALLLLFAIVGGVAISKFLFFVLIVVALLALIGFFARRTA